MPVEGLYFCSIYLIACPFNHLISLSAVSIYKLYRCLVPCTKVFFYTDKELKRTWQQKKQCEQTLVIIKITKTIVSPWSPPRVLHVLVGEVSIEFLFFVEWWFTHTVYQQWRWLANCVANLGLNTEALFVSFFVDSTKHCLQLLPRPDFTEPGFDVV